MSAQFAVLLLLDGTAVVSVVTLIVLCIREDWSRTSPARTRNARSRGEAGYRDEADYRSRADYRGRGRGKP